MNIIQFLEFFRNHDDELRYHIAKKKIPSIGKDGKRVHKPTQVNGIKLEKFVFDVFPFSKQRNKNNRSDKYCFIYRTFAVWEVRREDEFSPLKNGTGNKDTPETCRRDLLLQHSRYVQQAGATLQQVQISK